MASRNIALSADLGTGTPRSRALVEERRAGAYSMYLKGFGEQQIAEILHMNQSTVSRALEAKRRENSEWLEKQKDRENPLRSFFQEEKDRYLDLLQEQWNHYYSIPANNVSGRSQALSVMRATLGSMSNMAGRLVAELDALHIRKQLDEIERLLKEKKEGPAPSPLSGLPSSETVPSGY